MPQTEPDNFPILQPIPANMRKYPISFVICTLLAILCAVPGVVSMAGFGTALHPLLADEGAGLALVVSASALFGSGMFPLVISRLRTDDSPR